MASETSRHHAGTMKQHLALTSLAFGLLIEAPCSQAQEAGTPSAPADVMGPSAPQDSAAPQDSSSSSEPLAASVDTPPAPTELPSTEKRKRHRLFPIGGRAAIERGYRIPEPWGLGMLMGWNENQFEARDLSAAVRKGADPSTDITLIPLPSVTTDRLEGKTRLLSFKADLWVFPGVNLFASIGKVKGTNKIDVAIDLDQVVPFPFCRPSKPCGTVRLPVETKVDNTTVTLGTILVYGNEHWFLLGSVAKTVSISSKKRSDVKSTTFSIRSGPRFRLGKDTYFAPYLGVNYFDLETTVQGLVASGPLFDDGDGIHLRYNVDMKATHPWAFMSGFSFELNRHLTMQAEVMAGPESTRVLASTGVRF